jgi:heme/copper-type cytochrome/quinol oxidase subunit 2
MLRIKTLLACLLVPAFIILSNGVADAAETRGHITAIDRDAHTMSVKNWHFTYPEDLIVDDLSVGDNVKVYFKIKGSGSKKNFVIRKVNLLDQ